MHTKTLNYGGGAVIVWGSFSWFGVVAALKIIDKMDCFIFRYIVGYINYSLSVT